MINEVEEIVTFWIWRRVSDESWRRAQFSTVPHRTHACWSMRTDIRAAVRSELRELEEGFIPMRKKIGGAGLQYHALNSYSRPSSRLTPASRET